MMKSLASKTTRSFLISTGKRILMALFMPGTILAAGEAPVQLPLTNLPPGLHIRTAGGNGVKVAVVCQPWVWTSTDGAAWVQRPTGIVQRLHDVAFGAGLFVAVGNEGALVASRDGILWAPGDSRTDNRLRGIAFGNGKFVAVGYAGTIITSKDGLHWTLRDYWTTQNIRAVVYEHGMFVAVGSHTILTSPGGQRWRERPCPIAASLEHIECHAGLLIASDSAGIPVLVSTNGRKWLAY